MRFHPEAVAEARGARIWYAARAVETGVRFRSELKRALDQLRENPERRPPYLHGTHRIHVRRYPYSIVYRVRDEIQIIAIPHDRRRPGYWRTRLSWKPLGR